MNLLNDLLATLPDGTVQDICVGAFWTAVVVEVEGRRRCGLASTLGDFNHHHLNKPAVANAGSLTEHNVQELAALVHSDHPIEAGIGMATINALLPRQENLWHNRNAEDVLAHYGAGKQVVVVGHFPFVARLREQVRKSGSVRATTARTRSAG